MSRLGLTGGTMSFKVVLTDHIFPAADAVIEQGVLEAAGARLEIHECRDEEGLLKIVRDADGLLIERAMITRKVIAGMEKCRVLARYGVGYDCIDVAAATDAGIIVCNVPDYCVPEVADHTVSLLLALARSIFPLDAEVKRGVWDVYSGGKTNRRIEGQTLGMIGSGRIGRAVVKRALGFGLQVLVYDPYVDAKTVEAFGGKKAEMEEVLRNADYLTMHLPLSDATRHTINAERLKLMKPSAYVINSARGGLIDQKALYNALVEGQIAGAALDTLEQEPPIPGDPLLSLPNVIVTPHAAFYSKEASIDLHRMAAEAVAAVLQGKRPGSVVNPDVLSKFKFPLA
jgi:D-3-phosphoglycerate dehydrogenase / 2-oxoglutarate reductase